MFVLSPYPLFLPFLHLDHHLQEDTSLRVLQPCHAIYPIDLVQIAHCMFQPFDYPDILSTTNYRGSERVVLRHQNTLPTLPPLLTRFRSGGIPTEQSHRTKNGASPPFRRAAPFLGAGLPKRRDPIQFHTFLFSAEPAPRNGSSIFEPTSVGCLSTRTKKKPYRYPYLLSYSVQLD